jgi:hypothetical protein
MSTSYVSRKLKVNNTKAFRDSFKQVSPRQIGYIFLSKTSEYPDPNTPTNLVDTVEQEKKIWDDMIGAKKIVPKDIEFVIPRIQWQRDIRYKQYDDKVPLDELLSISQDGNETVYPMYVINLEGDVYKCLCNNVNSKSQVEPIGRYTENDGFIQTESGEESCYLWKYMYNIKETNKFLTEEWMPVPYTEPETNYIDYDFNTVNLVDGSLNKIKIETNGLGYFHSEINVEPFLAGSNTLVITDDIDLTTSNTIKVDMFLSGNGIYENQTYITIINPAQPKTLYLSEPTISSGGGNTTTNRISVLTRVVIQGDGTETLTSVDLDANTSGIKKINVTNAGIGYTKANVTIYGSGTNATARAILPPKFGHGYNPAMELGADNVMIISRVGEIDSTENNSIPEDIFFRQYGLLTNPYKYSDEVLVTEKESPNSVRQTTDLDLLSFSNFTIGEMVYQGSQSNPDFLGYVVYQNNNIIKLNNVFKEPVIGSLIIGSQSGSQNLIVSFKNPDLKPYAGDILYSKNILKVQRSLSQAEEIKLVFQF